MDDLSRWQRRPSPQPVVIDGRYCRLEPLSVEHADTLYAASMSPGVEERFRFLTINSQTRSEFDQWLEAVSHASDPLYYAVIDKGSFRCEGRLSLMRIEPSHGVIEVGNILWGPAIARTRVATEAFFLIARYVFDQLGYRRFEWKCDSRNKPSRAAALRFGFAFEGIFSQHMIVKGENRDTAWFAMLDHQWPLLRQRFERWLEPTNFDSTGRQLESLRSLAQP